VGGLVGLLLACPAEWGPTVLYGIILGYCGVLLLYVVHSNATVGEVETEMERKS
jgi:hypothetical protein